MFAGCLQRRLKEGTLLIMNRAARFRWEMTTGLAGIGAAVPHARSVLLRTFYPDVNKKEIPKQTVGKLSHTELQSDRVEFSLWGDSFVRLQSCERILPPRRHVSAEWGILRNTEFPEG